MGVEDFVFDVTCHRETVEMYLVIVLRDIPKLVLAEHDMLEFIDDEEVFVDRHEEWAGDLFLGFYDWLRAEVTMEILGVNVTLHDGRERLSRAFPVRSYVEWISSDVFRIILRRGRIDEEASSDQEFSTSRCLLSSSGNVALLFDAVELTEEQLNDLRVRHSVLTYQR